MSCGSSSYIAISSSTTSRSGSTSSNAGRQTMSLMTSKARGICSSSIRAWTLVVSLPVAALSSAPIASKIWSISVEENFEVPRKSRCSMKCERPASSWDSTRAPVPIQNPSATDLTEGIASVTTRTPESSSVSRCS